MCLHTAAPQGDQLGSVMDKMKVSTINKILIEMYLIVDKIWNLTNAVHLVLTEWKPFSRI